MAWAGVGDATEALRSGPGRWGAARTFLRGVRRRMLRRGEVTQVALTAALADEVAGALDGTPPPVVIPTPVDVDANRPVPPDERAAARTALGVDHETVIVFAGHLRASKRVDRLIDAVAVLHAANVPVRLFVLGDSRRELDDCSEALREQVRAGGLEQQVVFGGGVPDIRPYLHAADVFVLPSEREGLSNALLEALACGVPCVAPASAGGDQVLDDSCGAVPRTGDAAALAAAIRTVTDPTRWPGLAVGARARAQRYSVDAVTGNYERLYAAIRVARFG
jgi:glycosyltransferase involved in cell wall biosynthesis